MNIIQLIDQLTTELTTRLECTEILKYCKNRVNVYASTPTNLYVIIEQIESAEVRPRADILQHDIHKTIALITDTGKHR